MGRSFHGRENGSLRTAIIACLQTLSPVVAQDDPFVAASACRATSCAAAVCSHAGREAERKKAKISPQLLMPEGVGKSERFHAVEQEFRPPQKKLLRSGGACLLLECGGLLPLSSTAAAQWTCLIPGSRTTSDFLFHSPRGRKREPRITRMTRIGSPGFV